MQGELVQSQRGVPRCAGPRTDQRPTLLEHSVCVPLCIRGREGRLGSGHSADLELDLKAPGSSVGFEAGDGLARWGFSIDPTACWVKPGRSKAGVLNSDYRERFKNPMAGPRPKPIQSDTPEMRLGTDVCKSSILIFSQDSGGWFRGRNNMQGLMLKK